MKIGLMIIPDVGEHYGIAWDKYDEKHGFHQKDLRRLFRKAKENLADKEKCDQNSGKGEK